MKLTLFLIILACFKVSASAYAQTITLNEKNSSLAKVLKQIERQSGYSVFYDNELIKQARAVSVKIVNATLTEALDNCFKNQPLAYDIIDQTIVIKNRSKNLINRFIDRITNQKITGKVTDENGTALPGASVKVVGTEINTTTDAQGQFIIFEAPDNPVLQISYIGYKTKEVKVSDDQPITIKLELGVSDLEEVSVVSTGYQTIPKERATGSFTLINNNQLNRSVSTNILDRLIGITSGLLSNDGTGNDLGISIRGRSTIFANTQPLIVVDNFPYDGNLASINPNDIENVTVLKDAAAASIWGARSGNGVIVITTKKGSYNEKTKVSFNNNLTIGEVPDLSYVPNISASGYIEMEKLLFTNGFYDTQIGGYNQSALTPVIETLIKQHDGEISQGNADAAISDYQKYDSRNDFKKYLYRRSFNQQYAINLNGGSQNQKYYVSAGFDKNLSNLKSNGLDRVTLNANNTYSLLKNKLEVTTGVLYMNTSSKNNGISPSNIKYGSFVTLYPYARLADNQGNHLSIPKYRQLYIDTVGNGKLLNWNYRPLDELATNDNKSWQNDLQANLSIHYKIDGKTAFDIKYLLGKGNSNSDNLNTKESYYTRNLINRYTENSSGTPSYAIPLGSILNKQYTEYDSQNVRAQITHNNNWKNSDMSILAGTEVRNINSSIGSDIIYGYDKEHTNGTPVDNITFYTDYVSGASIQVPYGYYEQKNVDRYVSLFGNVSYSYKKRYIISGSARQDASNLVGVNSNQKWIPLWSLGGSWIVTDESFYRPDWVNHIKLRATYGYNGNVDKSVTAFLVTSQGATNRYGNPFSSIENLPNPNLRWERIGIFNLGLDFGLFNNRISGSFDYFVKSGIDLMGYSTLPPSVGATSYKGNTSNIKGKGLDLVLNTVNTTGAFKWRSTFLVSRATDKVTAYNIKTTSIADNVMGNIPIEGKPVYAVFSYRSAGLDPATGDPRGYLNGQVSKEYGSILLSNNQEDLVYHGSMVPTVFGSIQNSFSFRRLSLSFLLTYKLGYYFRKSSVNYNFLFNGLGYGHSDFNSRWQKPGDELSTKIPSMIYPNSPERDDFYTYSEDLVEKGDHIRLKDIQMSYDLAGKYKENSLLNRAHIFVYLNNLGIIRAANKSKIDPDAIPMSGQYTNIPTPKSISLGLKLDL